MANEAGQVSVHLAMFEYRSRPIMFSALVHRPPSESVSLVSRKTQWISLDGQCTLDHVWLEKQTEYVRFLVHLVTHLYFSVSVYPWSIVYLFIEGSGSPQGFSLNQLKYKANRAHLTIVKHSDCMAKVSQSVSQSQCPLCQVWTRLGSTLPLTHSGLTVPGVVPEETRSWCVP